MNAAGDPAGAAAALGAALARAPAVHELANNLGSAELQLGRPAAGRVAFEHALRLEPGNALYRFNRGLALDRLGLVKERGRQCSAGGGVSDSAGGSGDGGSASGRMVERYGDKAARYRCVLEGGIIFIWV